MPTPANALAVMAKAPIAGEVKTRLVPLLTHEQAADLYRALLLDQLEHLSRLTVADLYLVYAPGSAAPLMKQLAPPNFHCFAQRGGDLSERMDAAFIDLWRRGHRNVVLVGSDLPALPLSYLETAFGLLVTSTHQVVLGPSRDGGYYLVGMNQPTPEMFQNMTWSHNQVLAQTTDKLGKLGIQPALLPGWFDIDSFEDLKQLKALSEPTARGAVRRTLSYIEGLGLLDRLNRQA
ncbi:MAG TPA: TIGR04282 family arsenosugar biosynthesis glycosyltransferase [Candidatus Binatia bacterium]|nr:TIGR04282 family arsenosugar biosynthesis glycosyltransferase [Candidatus Binatia bacterium]